MMKPTLEWLEDPEVFQINRCPAHSDHRFYQSRTEMEQRKSALFQSLNGIWKFSYAENPGLRDVDFYKEDASLSGYADIEVPGHIQLQGYDRCQYINTMYPWDGREELRPPHISKEYNPTGSYVKLFHLEEGLKGKRIFLSFQGVETAFYVWLNGRFVGYGEDSFTPSEYEVTEYIKEGENKLAVEVYKRSSASWLEDQDFWRFSGIFRDVYLYAVPKIHIRDIFVRGKLTDNYTRGILELESELLEEESGGTMELCLRDENGQMKVFHTAGIEGKKAAVCIDVGKVDSWSAENPCLYSLEICVKDRSGRPAEWIVQDVGFRCFEMMDNIMCINGKRIVFHGVNRHEFSARRGRSITEYDML